MALRPSPDTFPSDDLAEPFIDTDELATWLGTTPRHVRRLVDEQALPVHRVGRKVRYRRSEIVRWLNG
jgi:excisionase family DNA binding protein